MKYFLLTTYAAIAATSPLYSSNEFIEKAAKISLDVTKGTPILPSVQIAQAIEESGYGKSKVALVSGNYFGLRKRKNRKAPYKYEQFSSMRESFEAYVKRLKQPRYKIALMQKTPDQQVVWIARLGYCPDPQYAKRIINIINKYGLRKYDKKSSMPINFVIR